MKIPSDQDMLNAIKAAYYGLLSGGIQEYTMNGRSYRKIDLALLRKEMDFYETRIAAAAGGGISGGTLLGRFN